MGNLRRERRLEDGQTRLESSLTFNKSEDCTADPGRERESDPGVRYHET